MQNSANGFNNINNRITLRITLIDKLIYLIALDSPKMTASIRTFSSTFAVVPRDSPHITYTARVAQFPASHDDPA